MPNANGVMRTGVAVGGVAPPTRACFPFSFSFRRCCGRQRPSQPGAAGGVGDRGIPIERRGRGRKLAKGGNQGVEAPLGKPKGGSPPNRDNSPRCGRCDDLTRVTILSVPKPRGS
eukprot:scaffold83595_cov27-Tisochrysis_lutea.AAC.3